ncbi:CAAX amino terminal protease self- immunity [Corynebacterium atrinae]|nr:CAAX amino terminal protease self- immunity [Corynebacterium atrinae]
MVQLRCRHLLTLQSSGTIETSIVHNEDLGVIIIKLINQAVSHLQEESRAMNTPSRQRALILDRLAISPMRWWWAIVVYVIAIVVTSALSYGGLLIGWEWISSQGQMVGYALALPIVLLVFGRKLSRPLGWIGLGGRQLGRTLLIGTGYGLACWLTVSLLQRLFNLGNGGTVSVLREGGVGTSVSATVTFLASVALIAPVCEELYFRAGIFRPLRDGFSKGAAVGSTRVRVSTLLAFLLSGVAFVSVHGGGAADIFLLFVLAAFFTLAYLTTSSLTGAVAAHAVNNIISLYGALAVMGNLQWWVWVVPAAGGIIAIAVSVALGGVFDKADNDASIAATHGTSS